MDGTSSSQHKGSYQILETEIEENITGTSGCFAVDDVKMSGGVAEAKEVDVDDVLNELKLGYFHHRLLFVCGLSYMADAVEIGFLSYASLCIKEEWNLSTFETSSITASLFFGSLVGNIFVWQKVADTYGRRPACVLGNFIVLFFGLSTMVAPSLNILVIILFFTGVGVGSVFVPFDLLAEYLPAKHRGEFLTNINYFWTSGSLFVSFGAWCVIPWGGWRALAVAVATPVLLSLALTVFFLPESPRWLVLQGRPAEARDVLLSVASINRSTLSPFHFTNDVSSLQSSQGSSIEKGTVWSDIMMSKPYRAVTFKLMLLSFAWGLSYYAVVLLISRMYSDDEISHEPSVSSVHNYKSDSTENVLTFNYEDIFLNALCELVGIFLTSRIIDRLGRRHSQGWLYGCGALSHVLTALFYEYTSARNLLSALSRVCIIGACGVSVVMTPELYPTNLRVGGHALANSASRIGSILAPFLAQNTSMSVAAICVVLAVVDVSAAVLAMTLPETAGQTLEKRTEMAEKEETVGSDGL